MRRSLLVVLLFVIPFLPGCNNTGPEEDLNYTLRVVNDFGVTLNIYLNAGNNNEGFQDEGIVPAQGEILITDLVVDVNYVLRAVEIGSVIENYVFEELFINSSTSTREITVVITG